MNKKEELSEQYRRKAYEVSPTRKRCQHNNEVIDWNNEIVEAFKSGWDTAINNLWHEASEEPKIDSLVLVCEGDTVYVVRYIGLGGFNNSSDYCEFSNYKWVYISDILPNEE